ncbi:MAG: TetR/AcrR family transcriptional regulator [Sphaerochaetaceae bacterium]
MPPRTRIERSMIIQAAYEIAREKGIEAVNARSVSSRLGCSTQPVLYCFSSMEELKRAVYAKADEAHTAYITELDGSRDPVLQIGLNYVEFARTEKNLFKLLFQSDSLGCKDIMTMLDASETRPIIEMVAQSLGCSFDKARRRFASRFFLVHGIASLMANNSLAYDKDLIESIIMEGRD